MHRESRITDDVSDVWIEFMAEAPTERGRGGSDAKIGPEELRRNETRGARSAPGAFKAIACRVALAGASVGIVLAVLEGGARLYLAVFCGPRTHQDYRKTRPEPYADADYFSKAFVEGSFRQPGKWKYPKGTNLIIPGDYSSEYFNVVDGKRVTSFQPKESENTVFLFGGSTVYNAEVPDHLTIASWLQRFFNEHYPNKYMVENYGVTSVATIQQLERLKTLTSFRPGDIIVFYDGVNEVYQGVFYANPGQTIVERNRLSIRDLSFLNRVRLFVVYRSRFAWLFLNPINYDEPEYLSDTAFMDGLLEAMESRFKKTIREAHDYATEHHALFFHFLQPHLYSDEVLSGYEKRLSQNPYLVPRGIEKSFAMGYPRLRMAAKQLSHDIHSVDLTDILNERPAQEEYFLDSAHVTHEANRIIAAHIFRSIEETFVTASHGMSAIEVNDVSNWCFATSGDGL